MSTSRSLYLSFYILYLISLAIGLWYLLFYSGVPSWVWTLFAIAILIAIISVLIKEFLLVNSVTSYEYDMTGSYYNFWIGLYVMMSIAVFILIIIFG